MADVLARRSLPPSHSPPVTSTPSTSKKRKRERESTSLTNGDSAAPAQAAKRQKTVSASPAPSSSQQASRQLQRPLKASPVPLPARSPSPAAASAATRGQTSESKDLGRQSPTKAAPSASTARPAVNGSSQRLKRTPILPPPISPVDKARITGSSQSTGEKKEKQKKEKSKTKELRKSKSSAPSASADATAETSCNGNAAGMEVDAPAPSETTISSAVTGSEDAQKPPDSTKKNKKTKKSSVKETAIAPATAVNPADLTSDSSRRPKTLIEDFVDDDPQNVANLDATNDITGRELPQSAAAAPLTASGLPAASSKKKKKKEKPGKRPMEPFTDSVAPLQDESDQTSPAASRAKSKSSSTMEESAWAEGTIGGASDTVLPTVEEGEAGSVALSKVRQTRDLIRQNLKVSRDFGLEGALVFPQHTDYNTGFHLFNAMLYLNVPPLGCGYPLQAAVNLGISQYLFNYYPPAKGILICHANHKICPPPNEAEDSLTRISAGYANSNLWVSADLYIFRPTRGAWLRGTVSLQHESHIAVMIMGHWPASVARKRLPRSWRWVPDDDTASLVDDDADDSPFMGLGGAGYWSDGAGQPVMGQVVIRALDFDVVTERAGGTVVSIEASMLGEEDDRLADLVDELSGPEASSSQQRLPAASKSATKPLPAWRRPASLTATEQSSSAAASVATDSDTEPDAPAPAPASRAAKAPKAARPSKTKRPSKAAGEEAQQRTGYKKRRFGAGSARIRNV